MASAPTPTLNDTAPKVNLMDQIFHSGSNDRAVQTLQPGQAPAPVHLDLSGVIPVIFSVIFLIWVIYTVVAIYHWFRYRHKSWFAVPAIALHLFVSGSLILFMISGLE